ncbi:MAG: FecR domain-containing protein [Spirochaetaceae bacterium]|nr:FecR domain-containing protein [Spirochaetaceae bacterium]
MKPFIRILLGFIVGIAITFGGVALFGYLTKPKAAEAPPLPKRQTAVITHVAGPVYVIRGDETLPAYPGEELQPGDIVKVTEGAVAQVQLADKGSALLGSDTLVRFMKLTGADHKLDLRTEILTGSLSYKVKKLDDSENIVIEVDGTEYEVRGTEFVIEKSKDGTILIVGEGEVQVTGDVEGGKVFVGPDEQLVIRKGEEGARVEETSEENRIRLSSAAPMPAMPFGYEDAPMAMLVEIITYPPDSDIYIDGLKTGKGEFHGLLPEGTTIDIRIRRRGFKDYSFKLTANSDQYIEIHLVPSGLEETLAEKLPENPNLARLRADYERRLAELNRSFTDQSNLDDEARALIDRENAQREAEIAQDRARREADLLAQLEIEKARGSVLETELADSRSANEKLKDLIQQIQELTE